MSINGVNPIVRESAAMTGDPQLFALFALSASDRLGEAIAVALGIPLSAHEERSFEDGEHKIRPLESVRGRDVYVLSSLYGEPGRSPDEKLCRLLFFIAALRDSDAARVTAVAPYLAYARKDRRTQARDPVTTRYVATLFEAVGVDRVVTLDVHNLAAFQNAFRCRTEHIEARMLFVRHLLKQYGDQDYVVVSPDAGGEKRADRLRTALADTLGRPVPLAFMEKQRAKGVVTGDLLVGNVRGRRVVIVDDLISTGTTIMRAARACRDAGAAGVIAMATHGLFMHDAPSTMDEPVLERIVVTDSVPPIRLPEDFRSRKVEVLPVAPLLGEAIGRMHRNGSLVDLLAG